MTDSSVNAINDFARPDGKPPPNFVDRFRLANLDGTDIMIPRLGIASARTLVRDRWEQLVTSIDLPASLEIVWQALTNPDALKLWLAVCHGSLLQVDQDCMLDFEDGEFFLCRSAVVEPSHRLQYFWRWLGIGQATSVTWDLEAITTGTRITVTEEALNPPWDWQTWNGGGWNGILDQLANYLRTGTEWRWCWRRMGPYAQIELPASTYETWDRLFSPPSLKYWLLATQGNIAPNQSLPILIGDASGMVEMAIQEVVLPGQSPPSFLPHISFSLTRPVWQTTVEGRLWLEPAGWGRSFLQVFHYNWENLPAGLQLSERKIFTRFWADAMQRASLIFRALDATAGPHNW